MSGSSNQPPCPLPGLRIDEVEEDRTQEWQAFDAQWRAEKKAQEDEQQRAHEARLAREAAERRELEIKALVLAKAQAEQRARLAKLREEAEAELAQREQGDAA